MSNFYNISKLNYLLFTDIKNKRIRVGEKKNE